MNASLPQVRDHGNTINRQIPSEENSKLDEWIRTASTNTIDKGTESPSLGCKLNDDAKITIEASAITTWARIKWQQRPETPSLIGSGNVYSMNRGISRSFAPI